MSECIFCQLIQKNHSTYFSDEHLIVLDDINPQAPIHQLIIPKQHITSLNELTSNENWLIGHLLYTAKQQAAKFNVHESGFRTVFNCNKEGGQAIFHIHLHLLGGRPLNWPPG